MKARNIRIGSGRSPVYWLGHCEFHRAFGDVFEDWPFHCEDGNLFYEFGRLFAVWCRAAEEQPSLPPIGHGGWPGTDHRRELFDWRCYEGTFPGRAR